MNKSKNILIIGGNGFIGSHFADLFLKMNLAVRILDVKLESQRPPLPTVDYRIGDINEKSFLKDALKGQDIIFNLANTTVPATSNIDCSRDVLNNLLPNIRLLELMAQNNFGKMIFISSGGAVYGNTSVTPTPEENALQPISSYGVVKAAIENYITMFGKLYGMNYLIIRPSNLYGTRQSCSGVQGLINTVFDNITSGREITIWGDGSATKDYMHIDDLMNFARVAIEKDAEGVFNVGSGKGFSVTEIINIIHRITGVMPIIQHKPARSFDVSRIVLDISRAEKILGWKPEVSLEEGIRDLWEFKNK